MTTLTDHTDHRSTTPGACPTEDRGDGPTGRADRPGTAGAGRLTICTTRGLPHRYDEILTPEALAFVAALHDEFLARRHDLLLERQRRRRQIADGIDPDFRPETRPVRDDPTWQVAGHRGAPGLEDRRVEITGPTDPKMTINALNSGASCWLADAEDASSPTWGNVVGGQLALHDAIRGRLTHTAPPAPDGSFGKVYRVTAGDEGQDLTGLPTIIFRPRGWHLTEKHLRYTDRAGRPQQASAALVDFGLYFFHNATELVERGRGPYFYLPKLEGYREARLWNDVFERAQDWIGMPHGTVRATVLIETLPAAFEMDEILHALRDHCAGLNAGRWDYLFSVIKCFRTRGPRYVLPDRGRVSMTVPFLRAYTELLVQTCHRRGAHAMGGMSAFIPDRRNPEANARAFAQVSADKRREAGDGFDGSWVAHPDLIPVAMAEFTSVLDGRPHQLDRQRPDVHVTADDLLDVASARPADGTSGVTAAGLRANVSVGVRYVESWLRGVGAAAIDHLMEDAATAEISRSQVWQWVHNGTSTETGVPVTRERVEAILAEVADDLPRPEGNRVDDAVALFRHVALDDEYPTFLTIPAYAQFLG
ncbi:malate synthase A [Luteimicrobium subarcticum]|uniref:Malate synthase n=1 Tax=Luteimicrobium subarcticum TaxID=620910 RepID=A0A2M8WUV2_9MICO|nr:malate synthase A [Luteimicrobium subarcticum]PJI94688.1 malate synthase [Luteimicrobium subarcticum]